jgi:hypothetical protein
MNILHPIKASIANVTDHILLRNHFLKHVIEGKIDGSIELTGRRG